VVAREALGDGRTFVREDRESGFQSPRLARLTSMDGAPQFCCIRGDFALVALQQAPSVLARLCSTGSAPVDQWVCLLA
jgi:hypothetical protein